MPEKPVMIIEEESVAVAELEEPPVAEAPVITAPLVDVIDPFSYTPPPVTTPASNSLPINTKLTALGRIRQQYAGVNNIEVTPARPLTLEELQNAWNGYAEKLRENRNPAVQSFELAELRILTDNSFEAVVTNNLEYSFILQERVALTEHLQNWFNNKTLMYQVAIEERPESIEKVEAPLSSREQYQKLIQEYPLVKELKERLRLDLDY